MIWIKTFHLLQLWQQQAILWILLAGLLVIGNFFIHALLKRLAKQNLQKGAPWFSLILSALNIPLQCYLYSLLGCYGIYILANLLFQAYPHETWFMPLIALLTLGNFLWFFLRIIKEAEAFYLGQIAHDANYSFGVSSVKALSRLGQVLVLLIALLFLLNIFHVPISGLLTFGGISSLVLAYGAKNLVSNFLGSMALYLGRQFTVGDSIHSPDRDIEGIVEHIGWSDTLIRRPDKQLLYVPNSIFSSILLINGSRASHRRIYYTIGVRYQDLTRLPEIFAKIAELISKNTYADPSQNQRVYLDQLADSKVNFIIDFCIHSNDFNVYMDVKKDILLSAVAIIEACGASCAFPTTTVHLTKMPLTYPPKTSP